MTRLDSEPARVAPVPGTASISKGTHFTLGVVVLLGGIIYAAGKITATVELSVRSLEQETRASTQALRDETRTATQVLREETRKDVAAIERSMTASLGELVEIRKALQAQAVEAARVAATQAERDRAVDRALLQITEIDARLRLVETTLNKIQQTTAPR